MGDAGIRGAGTQRHQQIRLLRPVLCGRRGSRQDLPVLREIVRSGLLWLRIGCGRCTQRAAGRRHGIRRQRRNMERAAQHHQRHHQGSRRRVEVPFRILRPWHPAQVRAVQGPFDTAIRCAHHEQHEHRGVRVFRRPWQDLEGRQPRDRSEHGREQGRGAVRRSRDAQFPSGRGGIPSRCALGGRRRALWSDQIGDPAAGSEQQRADHARVPERSRGFGEGEGAAVFGAAGEQRGPCERCRACFIR